MPAMSVDRRDFLAGVGIGLAGLPFRSLLAEKPVVGPARAAVSLSVQDLGAVGDGVAKDTGAIQRALDRCAVLGGGEVVVPAGSYLTGALQLRSKVLLRLEKDAVVMGTGDFADYPVTEVRWEGKWIPGHIALIYAIDAEDTGIVGPGKIVGNAALSGRPTKDQPLRHPALIEPIRCRRIRFEDFSTSYARTWSLHPTECEDVTIRGLTIRSTGGNGDGIDVDSCRRVVIDRCDIATGDDCISLKSGRGEEGYRIGMATKDVTISNCTFADSIFACIGIGSETSGGIRNVRVMDCRFTGAKTFAIYIKSRPGRGPFLDGFRAERLEASGMTGGFLRLNLLNSGLQDQDPVPGVEGIPSASNMVFKDIKVSDCPVLVDAGSVHPEKMVDGFSLTNVSGTCGAGITLANMRRVVIKDVRVTGFAGPLLRTHDVTGKGLEGAVAYDGPKVPEAVVVAGSGYRLR
jgi:hypothetical protein